MGTGMGEFVLTKKNLEHERCVTDKTEQNQIHIYHFQKLIEKI